MAIERAVELKVTPEDLTFQMDGGATRVMSWPSLTEIRIRTASGGADLFWELQDGSGKPAVSIAGGGTEDNELMDGFYKRLTGVDSAAISAGMTATTDATFLVWRRA